jgi:hypothetical protein
MSDDTEWPNNVTTPSGSKSVWIDDPTREPLVILSRTKVQSPHPGWELHFLYDASREDWDAHVAKLERSGAYALVTLARLSFRDPDTGGVVVPMRP